MHSTFKRVALSIAALTAASAGLVLSSTSANAAPNDPQVAPAILLPVPPAGGNAINAIFTLNPTPAGASFCPGDSSAGGFSVRTFMTDQDPRFLTYNSAGPVGAGFTQPLFTSAGSPITGINTAPAAPPAVTGRILSLGNLSFDVLGTVPNGVYSIGIACVRAGLQETFYSRSITFQGNRWGDPAIPVAPALTTPNVSAAAPTVNFTQPTSFFAVSSYTATLTRTLPAPAGTPIVITPAPAVGSTSITLPVLTLGATYTLNMVANNAIGDSLVSNTLTLTPSTVAPAPIPITVPNPSERAGFNIGWTAPVTPNGGPAPTDYTVEILTNPASPGVPAVVTTFSNVVGTTQAVAAVPVVTPPATPAPTYPIGNYTARVTANYAPGSGVTPTAGSQSFSVTPNSLIFQEITVERPLGALVLTQRCGVYGALDPFVAVDAFPGFPRADATGRPLVASTPGIDERPDTDVSPAGNRTDSANPALDEYTPDPLFGSYPEQGTYPTECGLDMGTASLVTSGALAGQFYTASGRLNQVTVLDTRDTDIGWAAKGDIDDLFQQGSGSPGLEFDGNYLGWVPKVTSDSNPVGGSTYNQTVTAGATVLPGTGTPGAATPASPLSAIGLRANPTLASAPALAGLGIATLDARMNLLIPASVDRGSTGLYTATLSLTVA